MTRRGPRLFSVPKLTPGQDVLILTGEHRGVRGSVMTYSQKAGHPNIYKVQRADGRMDWHVESALEPVPKLVTSKPVLVVDNVGGAS